MSRNWMLSNRVKVMMPTVALCLLSYGCAKKVAVAPPAKDMTPVASTAPETAPPARPAERRAPETPATVAAAAPTSRMPDQATRDQIQTLLNRIQDAYFDYNTHNIRPDAEVALRADATTLSEILKQYPDYKLTIEGYADERGSEEYNLGLGDARAKRAKGYLVDSGIPASQLLTVSFGKERPVCTDHDEACWQKNRRVHITQSQGESRQ